MKINNEAKVGLMITISFTIFITMVAILAKINLSRTGYEINVYFGFLNDLSTGASVKIGGGIKIGYVKSIKQSDEKTVVTVWIEEKYTLLKSTKFAIFTSGLIGEKYINVFVPPTADVNEFLRHGDRVYGIDPASFDQMMLTFQSFMQDESGGEMLAEIFQNSKKFVENLNKISEENRYDIRGSVLQAKSTITTLAQQVKILMLQLNRLSTNMADISEKNKEEFSITMKNLSETTESLNKIIFRMEKGRGTIGKLMVEEDIYNNIKDASVAAKDLFENLRKRPSSLWYTPKK